MFNKLPTMTLDNKMKRVNIIALVLFLPFACLAQNISVRILETNLIYKNEPYPSCHASTIVETGNGMLAAWFGGTYEKHPDVCIYGAFYRNGKWEKPFLLNTA